MKIKRLSILLFLAVMLGGCAARQPGSVPQPPVDTIREAEERAWIKAVDYFGQIEAARHTGNQLALTLSRQNLIPVEVLRTFVRINEWSIQANKLLRSSERNFSKPVAVQVTLLAQQILSDLSQWSTGNQGALIANLSPALRHEILAMEVAAIKVKELR